MFPIIKRASSRVVNGGNNPRVRTFHFSQRRVNHPPPIRLVVSGVVPSVVYRYFSKAKAVVDNDD